VLLHDTFFCFELISIFIAYPKLMSTIRPLFILVLSIFSLSAFAQNSEEVFMRWKLKPGQVLAYKTSMTAIDTVNQKSLDFGKFFKSMGADSANTTQAQKMLKQFSAALQPSNLITQLTEKRKGIVDIEMISKPNDQKPALQDADEKKMADMQELILKMNSGVMLRGAVYESGPIESFYNKNDQKNIIAMLFELPGKNIKQGDSWSIDTHLLYADQNFKCDSSFKKNKVTAIKIENKNGEHLVTLKYDIAEYIDGDFNVPMSNGPVKTTMYMSFQALAVFSVEKGKWISYEGIVSDNRTGIMSAQNNVKYSLVEE
jgi:hypothetical protein